MSRTLHHQDTYVQGRPSFAFSRPYLILSPSCGQSPSRILAFPSRDWSLFPLCLHLFAVQTHECNTLILKQHVLAFVNYESHVPTIGVFEDCGLTLILVMSQIPKGQA